MTYSKLLELIEAMSDEQKAMDVVVSTDSFTTITLCTEVCHADYDDGAEFVVGQPILS